MQVGDLVIRKVNYGIDKGIGLIVGSRRQYSQDYDPKQTVVATYYLVQWPQCKSKPYGEMWYEASELEVVSESR